MSVRADIYTESSSETLAVPIQAVLFDEDDEEETQQEDQPYVFVVNDGTAQRRDVKTGISSDSDQEVLEGIAEGDLVISGPFRVLRNLKDGDTVEQIEEEEAEGDSSVTVSVG